MAETIKGLERIFKALANRRRLAIIKFLKINNEASVGQTAHAIKLSFRSTSKHLNILVAAEMLEKEQRGLQMYYRLRESPPDGMRAILSLV